MKRLRHQAGRLCMLLAVVFLGLALLRPSWPLPRQVWHYTFIFDISQSMNTRDQHLEGQLLSRLSFSKQAVQQALEHFPCGSTVGLGLYTANNTYQLFTPLEVCEHYSIISQVLQRIDWRMAWANDSYIQYGLYAAIYLLTESEPPPHLVFISDGDQSPKNNKEPAFMGELGVPGGFIVGTGSTTPGPVPHVAADGSIRGYWTRAEALNENTNDPLRTQPYLSQLDEGNLQQLAHKTGMRYYRLEQITDFGRILRDANLGQNSVVETDLRWLLAGFVVLFLLLSGWAFRPLPPKH